jgi:hypothetical protein
MVRNWGETLTTGVVRNAALVPVCQLARALVEHVDVVRQDVARRGVPECLHHHVNGAVVANAYLSGASSSCSAIGPGHLRGKVNSRPQALCS